MGDLDSRSGTVMALPVLSMSPAGATARTLGDVFGQAEIRTVRLVALSVIWSASADEELAERLWQFGDKLVGLLPTTTRVLRLNVIVPSGERIDAKGLLDAVCNLNIVVSTEDRAREGAADLQIDTQEHFFAHAALACATVAGLWHDSENTAFDQLREDAGARGTTVLARPYARVVDASGIPDSLIQRMLNGGVSGLREFLGDERPISDDAVVTKVVEAFLPIEDGVLYYKDKQKPIAPMRQRVVRTTWEMAVRFYRFLWGRPLDWKRDLAQQLPESMKAWLFRVTRDEEDPFPLERPTTSEIIEIALRAPTEMPRVAPPYPQLWHPLRQMTFALMDGGPLPPEMQEQWGTTKPRVSDPARITPDPRAPFQLTVAEQDILKNAKLPHHNIRPGDSNAVNRFTARLARATETLKGSYAHASSEQRAKIRENLEILLSCREKVTAWAKEQASASSVFGKIGIHLNEEMDKASNALGRRRRDYAREEEERGKAVRELETLRDKAGKLLRPFALGWAGLVVLVVLGAVLLPLDGLSGRVVLAGALFTALGAAFIFGVFLWFALRASAIEHELDVIEHRRRATIAAVEEWPTEGQRLGALYEILLDWGEILGWMLYEPFGESREPGGVASIGGLVKPHAFQTGLLEPPSGQQMARLASTVARTLFTNGWLSRLYDVALSAVITDRDDPDVDGRAWVDPDYSPGPTRVEDLVDSDAEDDRITDGDAGHQAGPAHARDRLLRGVRGDTAPQATYSHIVARIKENLRTEPPSHLLSRIDLGTKEVGAAEFFSAVLPVPIDAMATTPLVPTLLSSQGKVDGSGRVAQVHLWGSVLGVEDSGVEPPSIPSVIVHTRLQRREDNVLLYFTLIRLDITDNCDEKSLDFLAEDE
ncbi:hypothetical protein [Amycolatopsis sp. RTGN1]|uniref:hypothetical protein n=1 Tax=Amycolatopsis ponsaeliensis TaxID=2992142 RepID=UPI00254A4DD2|nr:hypothetical protein [Amycolatopsis sp. RTGN1]